MPAAAPPHPPTAHWVLYWQSASDAPPHLATVLPATMGYPEATRVLRTLYGASLLDAGTLVALAHDPAALPLHHAGSRTVAGHDSAMHLVLQLAHDLHIDQPAHGDDPHPAIARWTTPEGTAVEARRTLSPPTLAR